MLRIWLHGPLTLELDGVTLPTPSSERARALIGWLALNPGLHPRSEVASRLWPDVPADSARSNLRTVVWSIRGAWGEAADVLASGRTTIGLNADQLWVDAGEEADPDSDPDRLFAGVIDEWAQSARADQRAALIDRLVRLADQAEGDGDLVTAVRWSRRVCELRPLEEGAHRVYVDRLLRAGERAEAAVVTQAFADQLHEELGLRPSPATRAVHAQVDADETTAPRTPVFGRARELDRLRSCWRDAAAGHGQVVVISGEAGIGKTTLLNELGHLVAGSGGCHSVTSGIDVAGETPFAAWLDLAEGLAALVPRVPASQTWPVELNRLSPGLGARLGHPGEPPASGAPELERLRVFEALLRLVEWSCAGRPLLLAVDDAHRADRASLRLTAYVGRRLARLTILLVVTRREGVRRPELDDLVADLLARPVPVTSIELAPISDAEVMALARSLHRLDGVQLRDVVSAAEGNPLLAVEVARWLVTGSDGPPPNLRAAVAASMSRLPLDMVAAIELLAVAGRPLRADEVVRLQAGSTAELASSSEGLLAWRGGRLGFRHELLRLAVRGSVHEDGLLHERVAAAIDPEDQVEVAYHLAAAGRPAAAAEAWAEAASRARTVGALAEAADLLTLATEQTPLDGRLWLELAEVWAWAGRRAETDDAWERALAVLPPEAMPAAWCRRGRIFRGVFCHPGESLRSYRAARDLVTPETDTQTRVEIALGLAWGDSVAGTGMEFESLLLEAAELAPRPSARAQADVMQIRTQGFIRMGRFKDAAAVVAGEENTSVSPEQVYGVYIVAACALVCAQDDHGALALVDRALVAARKVESLAMKCLVARALVLSRLGEHEEAAATAERVQDWTDRLDSPVMSATACHDRGFIAMAAGRYQDAADLLGRALDGGAEVSRVSAGLLRAEALARAGDADASAAALRSALTEPVGPADQPWALVPEVAWVQALIALERGENDVAGRRLDEAERAWQRVSHLAGSSAGETYVAHLVDLGRPPVVGLIEPDRALERIAAVRATLPARARQAPLSHPATPL